MSKRERRPPRQPTDDLRDMKIDPLEFEGSLNSDHYIEWVQVLERFFEIKEYSDEKAFMMVGLKLKKYASSWMRTSKDNKPRRGSHGSKPSPTSTS